MAGIFISYRRDDAGYAALLLHDGLAAVFGPDQVFMDVHSIGPGETLSRVLAAGIERCAVLLALIGKEWLTVQREGRPRLLHDDDWVRTEIAHVLGRPDALVIPVLLEGVRAPAAEALPAPLRPLADRVGFELRQASWNADLARLADRVRDRVAPGGEDVLGAADQGLRRLHRALQSSAQLGAAVARSREELGGCTAEVRALMHLKKLHDAIHVVEEVQRELEAGPASPAALGQHRLRCRRETGKMIEALEPVAEERELLTRRLRADIDQLRAACDGAEAAVLGDAIAALVTAHHPDINRAIAARAARVDLERLAGLLRGMLVALPAADAGPVARGADALGAVARQLKLRVAEHGRLQRLDEELRDLSLAPDTLPRRRHRLAAIRAELQPPHSGLLEEAQPTLAQAEQALLAGGTPDLVTAYAGSVAFVFKEADGELKELCTRIAALGDSLDAVLTLLGPPP